MDKLRRLERRLRASRGPTVHDVLHVVAKAEAGDAAAARLARLRPTPHLLAGLHQVAYGSPDCGPACPCGR